MCSSGYTAVTSPSVCAFPLVGFQVQCERCGLAQTRTCTACKPGFFGAQCAGQCPPSAANPCSSHGACADGLGGTGVCTCDTGYAGEACDQCAPDRYDYPVCTFCQAETTCSGHGVCNASGGCTCDPGFSGEHCDEVGVPVLSPWGGAALLLVLLLALRFARARRGAGHALRARAPCASPRPG